jgi:hypothetical protein
MQSGRDRMGCGARWRFDDCDGQTAGAGRPQGLPGTSDGRSPSDGICSCSASGRAAGSAARFRWSFRLATMKRCPDLVALVALVAVIAAIVWRSKEIPGLVLPRSSWCRPSWSGGGWISVATRLSL